MKIAVGTALSNSHVVFLDHLIKSVLKFNPLFNFDWYVFNSGIEDDYKFSLSVKNKNHLKSLYKGFKFQTVDYPAYKKADKPEPIYYSIDMFKLSDYDAVVYWGSDMLCMKQLTDLWAFMFNFRGIGMTKEFRRANTFNNGGMIATKEWLTDKVYNDLLNFPVHDPAFADVYGHDQKIYNIYFKDKIKLIPHKFNVMVTEQDFISRDEILMFHYFLKPTQTDPRRRLSQWQREQWDQYTLPGDLNGVNMVY